MIIITHCSQEQLSLALGLPLSSDEKLAHSLITSSSSGEHQRSKVRHRSNQLCCTFVKLVTENPLPSTVVYRVEPYYEKVTFGSGTFPSISVYLNL